jgi:hypothetical protein
MRVSGADQVVCVRLWGGTSMDADGKDVDADADIVCSLAFKSLDVGELEVGGR